MRLAIKETEVFKFEELTEEFKQNAIEHLYDINTDFEWYNFLYEQFNIDLKKIGIECKGFYFSLDRNYFIAMDKPYIVDTMKFLKYCKIDLRTIEGKELLETITIDVNYFTGARTSNSIDNKKCEEVLQRVLTGFLKSLNEEYDYLTSKKAIIETIESNGYEFTKEGNLY